jgi:hypothetical protein
MESLQAQREMVPIVYVSILLLMVASDVSAQTRE